MEAGHPIGIPGDMGIPDNLEAGDPKLGSHRNTGESIGIPGSLEAGNIGGQP